MTDEFSNTINQRLEVLRAERERIVQEYQKQLDAAVAPYNAAIGELEQLLERLESNHKDDAQGVDGAKKPCRRHGARSGAKSGAKENALPVDETIPEVAD